jgi:hypothetical protein
MRLAPLFALATFATAAFAAEDPLTVAEFEAYVTGKTLSYSQYGLIFGIEEYLPGRKVRWKVTEDECQYGHWYEKNDLICFVYEYDLQEHCWKFWMEDGNLTALSIEDLPGEELSEVNQTSDGLNCPGPDVGV